jgi:hypothetical protein
MSRDVCSHCGADVPRGSLACPECGSDAETGWADEADLHEAAFGEFTEDDYREVVRDLRGAVDRSPRRWILLAIAILTLALFVLTYVL